MTNVLVIYASTLGNTRRMAEAAREGAASVPATKVTLKEAEAATLADTQGYHAILVGSPVRHRSADSRIKAFIERVFEIGWLSDSFVGCVGGVFTVGGGYGNCGAGCELTQLGILSAMAGCGMLIVPFPKITPGSRVAGMHWGPHGRSGGPGMEPIGIPDEALTAAHHHGANVARIASLMAGTKPFAAGNHDPSPDLIRLFSGNGAM